MAHTTPRLQHFAVTLACLLLVAGQAAASPSVCLPSYQIRDTERPDDSTILFVMQSGAVWANHLPHPCTGLAADPKGFTYTPTDPGSDTICSNLVVIRLNTYQSICPLGAFTKVDPANRR